MSSAPLKDRLKDQYSQLLEAFSNLLRSARLPDESGDTSSRQGRVPGELMEVFAEKMLAACQALLGTVVELKRNALLNDVAGRNDEAASSGAEAEAEAAQLQQRFAELQRRIDSAMQLMPTLEIQAEGQGVQQTPPPQVQGVQQAQPLQEQGQQSEDEVMEVF